MSSISIIGLGGMARALIERALAGGHAVEVIGRDPAKGRGDRHYARRHNAPVHDDVATLEDFVRGGEGALAMVDENAVWREAESLPWGGEWRGPDGFARLTREIDVLAELTVRGHEIVRAGDVVELRLDAVFTSRKSGRQLPMTVVEHYRVHDGKIYGADAFYRDTQAVNDLVKNG